MSGDEANDLHAIRQYWSSPTAGDKAKAAAPGLVEYAQTTIYSLCNEVEVLRARLELCEIHNLGLTRHMDDVRTALLSSALQVPGEAEDLIDMAICPVIVDVVSEPPPHLVRCRKGLEKKGNSLVCDAGHEWDKSQSGWVLDMSSVED